MADIRCSNCGRNNPDFLDFCQFCQNPLKPESILHIGESPTKKQTGDLEPILPDWLKDVRKQARDSAEDVADDSVANLSPRKSESPDLLGGLASLTGNADEDEIPDWLESLDPKAEPKTSAPSAPAPEETDFFAQFAKGQPKEPVEPEPVKEPPEDEIPPWMAGQTQRTAEKDELSEWFSQASGKPVEPQPFEADKSREDMDWTRNLDQPAPFEEAPAPPQEKEDLGWLHDLEASAKQAGEKTAPKQELGWMENFETPSRPAQPASAPQEDLSWLDNLGGMPPPAPAQAPATPKEDLSWLDDLGGASVPPASPPAAPKEDLSWLNELGGASAPAPSQPAAPKEDLSWLNELGGTAASSTSQPAASQEDLSWLNTLGGTPEPVAHQPSAPPENLDWLDNLGGTSTPSPAQPAPKEEDLSWLGDLTAETESAPQAPFAEPQPKEDMSLSKDEEEATYASPFTPRQTSPLSEDAAQSMPDWLRDVMSEQPSDETLTPTAQPPLERPFPWMESPQESQPAEKEAFPPTPEPAAVDSNLFPAASDSSSLSNQEIDSLFSIEMPDWLKQPESESAESGPQESTPPGTAADDTLSPVELPSWVQAMRPVEAVISETASTTDMQSAEKEGPLAGLSGVIPIAPIGSSRRPKSFSLKLQATDEQQASAAILEQILAGEAAPRAVAVTTSLVMSQRLLRWAIAGLFLIVLGAIVGLRSQLLQAPTILPDETETIFASQVLEKLPESAPVLVVIDYEPSVAGEMEAAGGSLLDHMVLLHHPVFSFVSTNPVGTALAERLMANTKISAPMPNGLGYQAGDKYFNLGYLPGGAAGVLSFIQAPGQIDARANSFADYAAVVVMTDHAESGRVWAEQLQNLKQNNPAVANQPLLVVASAQAGPLLQPYLSSHQIAGMITGLTGASGVEYRNGRPGLGRIYWDAFGVGLMMAAACMVAGSLWSLFTALRARRAEVEQG